MSELVTKVAQAALQVGGKLEADKRNKEQNYDYISADKILSICGQALFANGVIVMPEVDMQHVNEFAYTDKYGNAKTRYDANVHFMMHVTDGETELKAEWVGMGSDYSVPDKAIYKAVTSGHKYFLMKLLNVGAGNEDSEHEPAEEPVRVRKPAAAPAPAIEYPAELQVVTNSKGVPYVELDSDALSKMQIGIRKALADVGMSDDDKATYAMKNDAINQILALRNGK